MRANIDDRVVQLERELRRISLEVGKYLARGTVTMQRTQPKIARISAAPGPDERSFPIIFQETEEPVDGGHTGDIDFVDRQEVSDAYACNLNADQPDHNERVAVWWYGENWWMDYRKSQNMLLVTADADIEHAATGTCSIAIVDDETDYEVYNPRDKIWTGAECAIIWNTTKSRWQVVQAWSATRIRGTVSGSTITAGGTGTLASVVPLNGHFTPTTVSSVRMPTTNQTAATGLKAWAELVWTGSASEWQIYQVDCPGA